MRKAFILLAVLLVCAPGCYHAVIETARPAGTQTIDILWAHSFVYGIVPPNVVNSAAQCPSGVARVVTEHSFLNGLVAVITWGIYTPIHITVTCASGSASLDVPTVKSLAEAEARLKNGETFLLPLREVGPSLE
jgi:hypothetical protein